MIDSRSIKNINFEIQVNESFDPEQAYLLKKLIYVIVHSPNKKPEIYPLEKIAKEVSLVSYKQLGNIVTGKIKFQIGDRVDVSTRGKQLYSFYFENNRFLDRAILITDLYFRRTDGNSYPVSSMQELLSLYIEPDPTKLSQRVLSCWEMRMEIPPINFSDVKPS